MKKILSLAFLGLLVFSAPAMAGIEKGQGEVGVDYGSASYDSDVDGAEFDSSDSLSLRGGYFFTNLFQLEGQYINSDIAIENAPDKISSDTMMVNGVFNFMPGKEIKPYVLVGVGQTNVDVDTSDDSATAYQIGAGSRFFFGKAKRAAFRFDVSMINQDFEEKLTNTTVAGGFTFRLGK